ncbi:MAG: MCE family protein [Phycisphaerales bacterium]|nr:MCE family protein [Phycisphaerales bacterium]
MQERRRNMLVGLFVLFGLVAFGTLIVMFGRGPTSLLYGKTYPVVVRFKSATGIRPGTLVTVWGKTIGRVQTVDFVDATRFDQGVRVVLAVESRYRLPGGSFARTSEPGLGQGRPPINIVPGPADAPPLPEWAEISGSMASAAESLIPPEVMSTLQTTAGRIGEAASALTPVLEDLHFTLQPRSPEEVDRAGGPQGNIASAAVRIDSALKHINDVLGDAAVKSHLREGIENFHAISVDGRTAVSDLKVAIGDAKAGASEFKNLMVQGQDSLRTITTDISTTARSAQDGLDKAGKLISHVDEIMVTINRGEGSIGKMVRDERLYESAVLSFRRLSELMEEFKKVALQWQKGTIRVAF